MRFRGLILHSATRKLHTCAATSDQVARIANIFAQCVAQPAQGIQPLIIRIVLLLAV